VNQSYNKNAEAKNKKKKPQKNSVHGKKDIVKTTKDTLGKRVSKAKVFV